jgi:hypothetical protein
LRRIGISNEATQDNIEDNIFMDYHEEFSELSNQAMFEGNESNLLTEQQRKID